MRLADELRRAVRDEAIAYRPGGTTFCALTADDVLSVDALERRVSAALREQGDGFAVAASVGRVTIPREAASAAEALRLADARSDLARRAADPKPRDASPTAALADALALTGDHALGAAELAEAVAKSMGLERARARPCPLPPSSAGWPSPPSPDAPLGKAGELSAEERAYVRDDPVIAEAHPPAAPAASRPWPRSCARAASTSMAAGTLTAWPARIFLSARASSRRAMPSTRWLPHCPGVRQ